ncbi:MAG: ABC transporter permease [Thermoprotei archaeon]|nr:MAG: ABC transporter permease [Thermoprotei archaeon]RLE94693.1 MAG: ABC transporter permease [Thermoprotei archaeon]
MRRLQFLYRIWVLCLKDMKLYYFKGPTIVMGILMPLFVWLAFVAGRGFSFTESLPALITLASFFASSSITPIVMPWEARQKSLEMLLSKPVTIYIVLLGTALASSIFGIFISSVLVTIGLLLNVIPRDLISLALGIAVSSLCYSFMGLVFSAIPSDVPADAVMLSSAVRLPLIFVSGIFIPVHSLPHYVKPLAFISPLTYFSDLIKNAYGYSSLLSPSIDVIALLLLTIIFAALALAANKRTLTRRL